MLGVVCLGFSVPLCFVLCVLARHTGRGPVEHECWTAEGRAWSRKTELDHFDWVMLLRNDLVIEEDEDQTCV